MDIEPQPNPKVDATSEQGAVARIGETDAKGVPDPFDFLDAAAKRPFSESEVSQAITIRFLVEKMTEYKSEIVLLKPYQSKSFELDRDLQVERAKNKQVKSQEIVSLALTTIGGAGMGLAIKFSTTSNISISGPAFVLFAGIVAAGVYLKVAAK